MGVFKEIVTGAASLVAGMGVTIRRIYRPVVTVQYPRQRLTMSAAYRGHIEFNIPSKYSPPGCVACGICMRLCPTGVIKVQGEKDHSHEPKRVSLYFIDFTHCSLCGLCVANCPVEALKFSNEYEMAYECRWGGVVDLIKRWEDTR
ncbi:MAG: 4Fe-4S binding protein [Deltaproteobacteria bacterium]|nr:4Fe-4S binding protein [Deltaproteobacteria bacterium]